MTSANAGGCGGYSILTNGCICFLNHLPNSDPKAVGVEDVTTNVLVPALSGDSVTFTSSGEQYTVILLEDGSAFAAGYIESLDNYQGHLGLNPDTVVDGVNQFGPLQVYAEDKGDVTKGPTFFKLFAGVENTPNSGTIHTILLDTKGRAWATGSNSKGQLCLGDNNDRMILELIQTNNPIIDIAIGGEHTLLLDDRGNVYGCGSNIVGQLGLKRRQAVSSPTQLENIPSVSNISAGHSHSLFMASNEVYVMGSNEFGQLCTNTSGKNVLSPRALNLDQGVAISFEATKKSSYVLYRDGSVGGCGRNNFGQLGDGTNQDRFLIQVELGDSVISLLGVGPSAESVFFYTDSKRLLGTGLNNHGQLGIGDTENRNIPTYVMFDGPAQIELISASEVHTTVLGTVSGVFPPTYSPTTPNPTYSPTLSGTPYPTLIGNTLFFWGDPESIGQDAQVDATIPVSTSDGVISASAGSKYTILVLRDGSALSAGYIESRLEYQGHLGLDIDTVAEGTNEFQHISHVYDAEKETVVDAPVFDQVFAGVENSPDSGIMHTILLDVQGHAWAVGSNGNGQLCVGDDIKQANIPERIEIQGRIVDVAIGGEHTLLLDEFGNVYGCGSNVVGQLGLGLSTGTRKTIRNVSAPSKVDGIPFVKSISAGHSHSLFLTEDGIYVTGSNDFGQLCVNTGSQNVHTPEELDINIDVVQSFEAIFESTYVLYIDGSVNSCGKNNFGQLGDGTDENTLLAKVELDGTVVTRLLGVGPSAESVFFVANNKSVYGTGLNDRGQLGTGDAINRNIPAPVKWQEEVTVDVMSVSGGHTLALGLVGGTLSPTKSSSISPTNKATPAPTRTSQGEQWSTYFSQCLCWF